jgi:hypothetical protein
MTEDPIVVRLAAAFAESVSQGDLDRAEEWAEAAWRRSGVVEENTTRA